MAAAEADTAVPGLEGVLKEDEDEFGLGLSRMYFPPPLPLLPPPPL